MDVVGDILIVLKAFIAVICLFLNLLFLVSTNSPSGTLFLYWSSIVVNAGGWGALSNSLKDESNERNLCHLQIS